MSAIVDREQPDLTQGGVVAVMLGEGGTLPADYAFHSQVLPIDGWLLNPQNIDHAIPHNTRAVVFGDGKKLPRDVFDAIHDILRRRRVMYLIRDNTESVKQALDSMVPPKFDQRATASAEIASEPQPSEKKQIAGRGQIKGLVEAYMPDLIKEDPLMPVAECARRLFRQAQMGGITTTTLESIAQAVRTYKKETRIGERPQSAVPEHTRVLQRIDAAIIELQQIRGYVEGLETRARDAERQVAKAKEVFAVFSSDVFTGNNGQPR